MRSRRLRPGGSAGLVLGAVLASLLACVNDSRRDMAPRRPEAPARALGILRQIAAAKSDVPFADMLLPREGALTRAVDSEDGGVKTRGRIVSEGWRSAKKRRFIDLGARLPDVASGEMSVGTSRFLARHARDAC